MEKFENEKRALRGITLKLNPDGSLIDIETRS